MKVRLHNYTVTSIIVRRYIRIAPLYYLALIVYALFVPWSTSLFTDKARPIPELYVILLYIFGLTNISVAINGYLTYFDVTWTLNVQDQFYLFWIPAFIRMPLRWQKPVCWLIIIMSQIFRSVAVEYYSENTIHVLTPFRMDALAIGCLFAIMNSEGLIHHSRFIIPITLLSSVLFIGTIAIFPCQGSEWFPRLGYSALGVLSMLWLWTGLTVDPSSLLGRMLCTPWLRWYGQRSYAVYLFHFFVYNALLAISWFIRHKVFHMQANIYHTYIQNILMGILTIPACIPVAWILWKSVEGPLNRIRDRVHKPINMEPAASPSP